MLIHCLTRTVITTFYLANRSRQQWYGNPEPEHQGVVATEIAHVWPGVGCGWWCNWGLDMVLGDDWWCRELFWCYDCHPNGMVRLMAWCMPVQTCPKWVLDWKDCHVLVLCWLWMSSTERKCCVRYWKGLSMRCGWRFGIDSLRWKKTTLRQEHLGSIMPDVDSCHHRWEAFKAPTTQPGGFSIL